MIPIEYILIPATLLNTITIAILVTKSKWSWAFTLALIQALIIGGFSFF